MKDLFRYLKWNLVFAALIYVALGIVLLIWPKGVSQTLCILLGILLAGYGIFQVVSFFTKEGAGWTWEVVDLLVGICALALGVFVLVGWRSVTAFFPRILGAVVIVDSCVSLKRSVELKTLGSDKWWISGLLAAATLIFGLVMVFRAFSAGVLILRVIGGVLLYEGLSDLVTVYGVTARLRDRDQI